MYDQIWEELCLDSGKYNKGDPYPKIEFDFYIEGTSEKNVFCSNAGIQKQIEETLKINPERQVITYFYYKRI